VSGGIGMSNKLSSKSLRDMGVYRFVMMLTVTLLISACVLINPSEVRASIKPVTLQVKVVPVDYHISGKRLLTASTDQAYMMNNRLHVPLRILGQALKQEVTWESKTTTVRFKNSTKPNSAQFTEIGNATNTSKKLQNTQLKITYPAVKFFINNQSLALTASAGQPFMYKNRLYVPLRFIAEAFAQQVTWDGKQMVVKISTKVTSNNTGDSGNSGGSGDNGGIVTDPIEEKRKTIIASTENKLRILQTRCQRDLIEIYDQYKRATTDEQKRQWIDKGVKALNTCDYTFNLIMTNLNDQLINIGVFPNDIVASYRKQYDERKQNNYDSITQGG
jgi:hypothetical protein